MPKDSSGKFHLSSQRANAASRSMSEPKIPKAPKAPEAMPGEEGSPSSVHEHLSAMHGETGGKHMHVQQHEAGMTSHHVGEDGMVEGPHEHESLDALKSHMDQFFNEEGQEGHSLEHQMATGHAKDTY